MQARHERLQNPPGHPRHPCPVLVRLVVPTVLNDVFRHRRRGFRRLPGHLQRTVRCRLRSHPGDLRRLRIDVRDGHRRLGRAGQRQNLRAPGHLSHLELDRLVALPLPHVAQRRQAQGPRPRQGGAAGRNDEALGPAQAVVRPVRGRARHLQNARHIDPGHHRDAHKRARHHDVPDAPLRHRRRADRQGKARRFRRGRGRRLGRRGSRRSRRCAPDGGRGGRRSPLRTGGRRAGRRSGGRFGRQDFQQHLPKRAQAAVVGRRHLDDVGFRRRVRRRRNRNLQEGEGGQGRGPAGLLQPGRGRLAGPQMQGGQHLNQAGIRIRRVGRQNQMATRTHCAAQGLQGRWRVGGDEGGGVGRGRGGGFEGGGFESGGFIVHRAGGRAERQAQNGETENQAGTCTLLVHAPSPDGRISSRVQPNTTTLAPNATLFFRFFSPPSGAGALRGRLPGYFGRSAGRAAPISSVSRSARASRFAASISPSTKARRT